MDEAAHIDATAVEETAVPLVEARSHRLEYALWLTVCIVSTAMVALVRWPTFLGVEALPWIRVGRDYPWRVWWRARDQYVNASRHTLLYLTLGGALAVVFIGTALVCLLLLLHDDDETASADS
jgi:hypothetical protein